MKTPGESIRNNKALEVYQRANDGLTIVNACRELGMPRSTFYDIVKRNPETIAQYQELIEAIAREQLGMILMHKTEILEKIINDALADTTKPKDRLVIYKSLSEWL